MREVTDPKEATVVARALRLRSGEKHEVLGEFSLDVFRGAVLYVLEDEEGPVSANITNFGKRKKNIFEPYANWYVAYTVPSERRKGHATALYRHAEAEALRRGCRRVRSLAGSAAGGYLHLSLGHLFWGKKDTGELFVDSPLPGHEALYKDVVGWRHPPLVPESEPWTYAKVTSVIQHGLRYDK